MKPAFSLGDKVVIKEIGVAGTVTGVQHALASYGALLYTVRDVYGAEDDYLEHEICSLSTL